MRNPELSIGISETLDILNHVQEIYVNKIPKKFMNFLKENQSRDYISNLDYTKKLTDMKLCENTKNILAIIYMNYWCSPQEKSEYVKLLKENQKKRKHEVWEKYNPDNLFKNQQQTQIIEENLQTENTAMMEHKESLLKRIMNKIKRLLNINE